MCGRDFLRMYLISPTECVWFMGVLEGQEAVQLRVSIFISFKVFHTPHPFSFNNPQLHCVFIFPTQIGHVW